jgi:dolichol-phosphate mannosyltransferase
MDVSIILPTYNERENILALIPKLERLIRKLRKKSEIIVVDDSSPDGTAEAARNLNKKYGNVRLILRKKKEGMGAAIKEGLDNGKGNVLLSMDVDSLKINDMEKLLLKLYKGYDLVIGSRYLKKGLYKKGHLKTFVKNFISTFGNRFARLLLGIKVTDFSLNCRAIKKDVWRKLDIKEKGNSFMLETVVETHFKGFKITEVPVVFYERTYGKSKLNLSKQSFLFLVNVIKFFLKYRLNKTGN